MSENCTQRTWGRNVAYGVLALLLMATVRANAQDTSQKESSRSYLGVMVVPAENNERGIVVREVTPASPAAHAGLKSGDRIIKIADDDVKDIKTFLHRVGAGKPGDKLTIRILRDEKEQTVTATLGQRPISREIAPPRNLDDVQAARRPAFLGIQTQPVTPEAKKRLNIHADAGLLVTEVVPNSPAAKAGLKTDDVITAINERPISDPAQMREAVQKAVAGREITLHVARGKENVTLKATPRAGAFGQFLTPGDDRFPSLDVESMLEAARRLRDLERRVEALEKRLREPEKK